MPPTPLLVRAAAAAVMAFALAAMAACSSPSPATVFESQLSYDRTFDAALGAMAEQKLVIGTQDRRGGRIVGALDGETITATLQPMLDGTLQVTFAPQNSSPAATALQERVASAYKSRVSSQTIFGGFKDSAGQKGPTPCPSGPAFCP